MENLVSVEREGINCGEVEVVNRSTHRWLGHLEGKGGDEATKRI